MKIAITATDRDGHPLETRTVSGGSFRDTFAARERVYRELKHTHRDHRGAPPYIFTQTVYETGD